jgi:hypothetical protein
MTLIHLNMRLRHIENRLYKAFQIRFIDAIGFMFYTLYQLEPE